MKYYSTNKKSPKVDFKTALLRGLAEDKGLYMPTSWAKISNYQFLTPTPRRGRGSDRSVGVSNLHKVLKVFIDIPEAELEKICAEAFNFPAPLVKFDKNLYILELFHGPTLSFKDFGARFMARVMSYYTGNSKQETVNRNTLKIVVATSGDTGSAVAAGFYKVPNIKVYILYPSGKVSELQEKQMATLGKNIVALEVKGDFDDCQRLAKLALSDAELRKKINISSANSINIGRLLPQMYYYFTAYRQLKPKTKNLKPIFVVPSGNFGNLTAGLFAKKIGLPVKKFIAAVNINSGIPAYLKTGRLPVNKTQMTLSNAMDVGNPSNWARIMDLYVGKSEAIKKDIEAITVTDNQTQKTIRDIYKRYGYIADPHTAVGLAAALKTKISGPKIVLATAHPAKFKEIVDKAISQITPTPFGDRSPDRSVGVKLPPQLAKVQKKKKQSIVIEPTKEALYKILKS